MSDEKDLIVGICLVFSIVSLVLSFWNAFRKLPEIERFSPLGLQIWLILLFSTPLLHGSPREYFWLLIWTIFRCLFSVGCARLLRHLGDNASKIFAFVLFVESASRLTLGFLNYASSCYSHYNHFVWKP